ncbi:MAG: histidine phosphatase family protein [Planctomycetota bacterium]
MFVHLMRHGIAETREFSGNDHDRPLTEKGRIRTHAACWGLRELGVEPQLVLSSPLVRAYQTAEIAREVLEIDRAIEVTDALEPGVPPEELIATLATFEERDVLCAGHSPNLDRVVTSVLGAPFGSLFLKKCGTASLELPYLSEGASVEGQNSFVAAVRGAELSWLLQPSQLRRIGGASE